MDKVNGELNHFYMDIKQEPDSEKDDPSQNVPNDVDVRIEILNKRIRETEDILESLKSERDELLGIRDQQSNQVVTKAEPELCLNLSTLKQELHAPEVPTTYPVSPPLRCNICQLTLKFDLPSQRINHILQFHWNKNFLICPYCRIGSKYFTFETKLRNHIKTMHPNKPVKLLSRCREFAQNWKSLASHCFNWEWDITCSRFTKSKEAFFFSQSEIPKDFSKSRKLPSDNPEGNEHRMNDVRVLVKNVWKNDEESSSSDSSISDEDDDSMSEEMNSEGDTSSSTSIENFIEDDDDLEPQLPLKFSLPELYFGSSRVPCKSLIISKDFLQIHAIKTKDKTRPGVVLLQFAWKPFVEFGICHVKKPVLTFKTGVGCTIRIPMISQPEKIQSSRSFFHNINSITAILGTPLSEKVVNRLRIFADSQKMNYRQLPSNYHKRFHSPIVKTKSASGTQTEGISYWAMPKNDDDIDIQKD